jgi:hypothetical protein
MQVVNFKIDQLHAREPPVPIGQEVEWAPEPVLMLALEGT